MRSLPDTFTYDQEWELNQKPFDLESEAQATQLHAPTKSTGMKRLCTHLSLASSCSSCCWTRISVLSSDTLPRTFVSRPAFVRGAHHTPYTILHVRFTTADSGSGHWTGTKRIACNNLWSKIKTLSTIVQVSSLSQLRHATQDVCQQSSFRESCTQDTTVQYSAKRVVGLCCLMTPGLSMDIQCHVWPYFSKLANHQIKHQATHKVGCQPGDCRWPL